LEKARLTELIAIRLRSFTLPGGIIIAAFFLSVFFITHEADARLIGPAGTIVLQSFVGISLATF
jgi:hypothetical protein